MSNAAYNAAKPDVVVMAVTSQLRPLPVRGEVWVREWRGAGLLRASAIKPVLATLEQALVIRTLGRLSAEDLQALRQAIAEIIG